MARLVSRRRDMFPTRVLVEERPGLFRRVFWPWVLLDSLSISVKFLFGVCVPFLLGRVVLVEEYVPAVIADYLYLGRSVGVSLRPGSLPVRYLLRLMNMCRPVHIVYLDAGDEVLRQRWRGRGTPVERRDYLLVQRTLLKRIAMVLADKYTYIRTGDKSPAETLRAIVGALSRLHGS